MDWNQFLVDLMGALVPIICTGVAGLLAAGTAYLSAMVKSKFGAQAQAKADEYLFILNETAQGAVVTMQQTVVDRLKKNGTWTKEAAEDVKSQAVRIALASLGDMQAKIQAQLKRDIPKYMEVLVEQQLKNLKGEGK